MISVSLGFAQTHEGCSPSTPQGAMPLDPGIGSSAMRSNQKGSRFFLWRVLRGYLTGVASVAKLGRAAEAYTRTLSARPTIRNAQQPEKYPLKGLLILVRRQFANLLQMNRQPPFDRRKRNECVPCCSPRRTIGSKAPNPSYRAYKMRLAST